MGRGHGEGIVGLVLAGGLAQRMGKCKALLPINGKSALELIANRMRDSRIERIVVVTGGHESLVHEEARRLDCLPVHNPAYKSGMYSSVLAGVRALPPGTEAFFLLPVDTPMIRTSTYRSLIGAFYENSARADILYPTFKGEEGHPPLIGRSLVDKILRWRGADGLRGFFRDHPSRALRVATADRGTQFDMDTPDDYDALLSYASVEFLPDESECEELLEIAGTPRRVIRHMRTVAACGLKLAHALGKEGIRLDTKLVFSSCMLHDIAKGEHDHEEKGAGWLRKRGYAEVAAIVATHKDLPERKKIGEAEVLYLADKLVDGEVISTLESRMKRMESRFAPGSESLLAAKKRIDQAKKIQRAIEKVTCRTIAEILLAPSESSDP